MWKETTEPAWASWTIPFVINSRGIPEEKAEQIMARARIDAVCNRIPQEMVTKP
ncbi:MAG: hypothetical protein V8S98_12445 [Lachnospiraceae bacterium]